MSEFTIAQIHASQAVAIIHPEIPTLAAMYPYNTAQYAVRERFAEALGVAYLPESTPELRKTVFDAAIRLADAAEQESTFTRFCDVERFYQSEVASLVE